MRSLVFFRKTWSCAPCNHNLKFSNFIPVCGGIPATENKNSCIVNQQQLHIWTFRKKSERRLLNIGQKFGLILNAFLSGRFVKLKDVPQQEKIDRFNTNRHYEKVKNQNFGPVPATECDTSSDHYGLTSWEFAKRDHLKYGGIAYHELPIALIQAKYNNTFVNITSHDCQKIYSHVTCGMAGFKHTKKKTVHAAETVGKQAAERALFRDCPEYVRVKIKGPGYGRAAAMRGLVIGGLKVASVTDVTPLHVDGLPQRPRAIRRV